MSDRYQEVGNLRGREYEIRDDNGTLLLAGSKCEPIWGCEECGAVVWLRNIHDVWHALNDQAKEVAR